MFCFNNNVCLCELIVLREAPCRVHGKLCNLLCFGLALIHMAGTSCIAWSDMGINEGFAAESTGHFLIWAALRVRLMEPIVILENVLGFPRWLLCEVMPMYHVDWLPLSPANLGWPISRERQYIVSLGNS